MNHAKNNETKSLMKTISYFFRIFTAQTLHHVTKATQLAGKNPVGFFPTSAQSHFWRL